MHRHLCIKLRPSGRQVAEFETNASFAICIRDRTQRYKVQQSRELCLAEKDAFASRDLALFFFVPPLSWKYGWNTSNHLKFMDTVDHICNTSRPKN